MNKKSNLFSDQTSSSRIEKLKNQAIEKSKGIPGSVVKYNEETNSRIDALARVRGGGYLVPPKVTNKKVFEPKQHIIENTNKELNIFN